MNRPSPIFSIIPALTWRKLGKAMANFSLSLCVAIQTGNYDETHSIPYRNILNCPDRELFRRCSISKCYGIPLTEDQAITAPLQDQAVTPSQQESLYPVGSSRYPDSVKVKKAWRCSFSLLQCIRGVVIRRKGKFILISLFYCVALVRLTRFIPISNSWSHPNKNWTLHLLNGGSNIFLFFLTF